MIARLLKTVHRLATIVQLHLPRLRPLATMSWDVGGLERHECGELEFRRMIVKRNTRSSARTVVAVLATTEYADAQFPSN